MQGEKKAESWLLVGETYAGPIASDKQVLGELHLVETKNTQNPSWLLEPHPGCSLSPEMLVSRESHRPPGLRECHGVLGASGNHWESQGSPGKTLKVSEVLVEPLGACRGRSLGNLGNALLCLGPSLRLAWRAHP